MVRVDSAWLGRGAPSCLVPFIEDEHRKEITTRPRVGESDRHMRIQQVLCSEAQTRRWTATLSGGCDAQPRHFGGPDEAASDRHDRTGHRHRREQCQGPCHRETVISL